MGLSSDDWNVVVEDLEQMNGHLRTVIQDLRDAIWCIRQMSEDNSLSSVTRRADEVLERTKDYRTTKK